MVENRKEKRRNLSYYMRVWDERTGKPIGHLSDVSPRGFRIDCQSALPVGQDFKLRLDLNNEVSNRSFMIFVARSKWRQTDKYDPNLYNVGFQLIKISHSDAQAFNRIMSLYGEQEKSSVW
ncbi:MAG: PilZ domain-containing protein [Anaerolineales bacterium]|nr:PilZ domain-containing protein [Anaerolineales bacterium]